MIKRKTAALLSALAMLLTMSTALAEENCAASIGSTPYATFDEAFAALKSGDTLKLESDCTSSKASALSGVTDVTLDLNGKTLTYTYERIYLDNSASLTITDSSSGADGTLTHTGWVGPVLSLKNRSVLTFEKGNITTTTATYGNGLISVSDSKLEVKGGNIISAGAAIYTENQSANDMTTEVYISGGNIESTGASYNYNAINAHGAVNLTITGGSLSAKTNCILLNGGNTSEQANGLELRITGNPTITASEYAIRFDGDVHETLYIDGGAIDGLIGEGPYVPDNYSADISITGGTFSAEPNKSYLAEGLTAELENGRYIIKEAATVTVTTENICSADGIDGTTATGFITTISGGALTINTIKWAVTHENETKYAQFTPAKPIEIAGEGEAKIGLVVDGFKDAYAGAVAAIN